MNNKPLADRMRPRSLDEIAGQEHLVGSNGILTKLLSNNRIPNMIFYGPPGIGKTTVANIIASASGIQFYKLNATTASIADIKDVISSSDNILAENGTLLYLDEIQYFNKKQQQSLLEFIENGKITLIASTTENPYYYVYNALLSRVSVFEFKSVTPSECVNTIMRAVDILNEDFSDSKTIDTNVALTIATACGGDVRMCINVLENAFYISDKEIDIESINRLLPNVVGHFDRDGDVHYDLLSCLQKSIRGSDPNAALFYLAKILAHGDMLSACRRLLVIASEDIGPAYPLAPVITYSCVESAKSIGMPEAAIPLANATCILATSPKSNSAYTGYALAKADMDAGMGTEIPKHLQSPNFDGYKYPHDYENNFVHQAYLPSDIQNKVYYKFGDNKTEQLAKKYYETIRDSIDKLKK